VQLAQRQLRRRRDCGAAVGGASMSIGSESWSATECTREDACPAPVLIAEMLGCPLAHIVLNVV
jgi:hypothetical protein